MEYVLEKDFQHIGFGPSQKAIEMFDKFEWLCFVGHSHRPGVATHDYKWIKPAELDKWAKKAKAWARKGDVFLYFISGAKVRNPAAAQALIERL